MDAIDALLNFISRKRRKDFCRVRHVFGIQSARQRGTALGAGKKAVFLLWIHTWKKKWSRSPMWKGPSAGEARGIEECLRLVGRRT